MNAFIQTIVSQEEAIRNRSFESLCAGLPPARLLEQLEELEHFRRQTQNLYERVRASLFLYAACRFFLANSPLLPAVSSGQFQLDGGAEHRISRYWAMLRAGSQSAPLFNALARSYHQLSFEALAHQVRRSVRATKGNQWMFRLGHLEDHPIRIHPALLQRRPGERLFPLLVEKTAVRMDLSHSGWSDIFFLGMDFPEGARVVNVSIDLGVYGRDKHIKPPIETYVRVIPEPLLRLTSVDLNTTKDLHDLDDLFNFGNDYLSLVKAGVIASGLIPPSFEGTSQSLSHILGRIVGPGMGLEVVTQVNDIPKGSRFAVSTNLLASMISLLMRATGQTRLLQGELNEMERRLVASRAILGEWIGGSGGGWQDSGGIWPGIKVITGAVAQEGDPEYGISRGCLLPRHRMLTGQEIHPEIDRLLAGSLVLMHGGMAQNVGPILEMVTEKYLLRSSKAWRARLHMYEIFDDILESLRQGDIQRLAHNTEQNFFHPIKTIIPWTSTHFTEQIVAKAKAAFGKDYWGFLMLGGMSGGGMGMFVNPARYEQYKQQVLEILQQTKQELSHALPFAMDPVVYNFRINTKGTQAQLLRGSNALMPNRYYALQVAELVRRPAAEIPWLRRAEIDLFTSLEARQKDAFPLLRTLVRNLFAVTDTTSQEERSAQQAEAERIRRENDFDYIQHEELRESLKKGLIGLSRNRLPLETEIEEVPEGEPKLLQPHDPAAGPAKQALQAGKVGILTLAGGQGGSWTRGAGVVKALNPFVEIAGKHRSFLEIHLTKTARTAEKWQYSLPHIVATSYLTHEPIATALRQTQHFGYRGEVYLSPGRSLGQRFIPMIRDLQFLWENVLSAEARDHGQKVQAAVRAAMIQWAREKGEGTDYTANIPDQRFSPLGHWYELSNLLRNGVLAKVLEQHPRLETLLLHSIDTLGVEVNPAALNAHLASGSMLTYEIIPRWNGDEGGALARVNGHLRLVEDLAFPREGDPYKLKYLPTLATWIQLDPLLKLFGLSRQDLQQQEKVNQAIRRLAQRMPTYVTIKEVKYRWGQGQEDVHPVAQVEKSWNDMSLLPEVKAHYLLVSRYRGQSLRSPDQLDAWANDGSLDYVKSLCGWK
ncbi:MAG: UTP--glucose-1-phosphate uridylyltransferase [Bacteroidetes bacterium]|nr:MAG: UTP--glucose-1-phosphate uridylyltransferase [Bacteroidota bacterium]